MINRKAVSTVGIFRALQLGDMLCSVPAFRSLRAALPHARITLIGLPWAKSLVCRFPDYLDEFIHFPGAAGLPEQPYDPAKLKAFEEEVRSKQFDLLIQMQGNGTIVNRLLQSWDLKQLAGFHNKESHMSSPLFLEYPETEHEIHRHLALMSHLGCTSISDHLEFPLYEQDRKDYEDLGPLPEKYIVVHAGSRGAWRQWPIEYFAQCADYAAAEGYSVIVTGTREEAPITSSLIHHMKSGAIDLTGKTSLGAMAFLIKNASLLISNCTGVSHIGSATETPSLIISMDGEPHRWAPLNKKLHTTIDWIRFPDLDEVYSKLKHLLLEIEEMAA